MRIDPLAFLNTELTSLKEQGLYRKLRILEGEPAAHATFDHKSVVNLSSNNYLGLTTHARLRERGYDQARELARVLGARLHVPVLPLLARHVATAAQTRLGAAARRQNVRAAFRCRAGPLPSHVALVDDVMTTGATLHECADVLRRAGVARIDVWVVARAAAPA